MTDIITNGGRNVILNRAYKSSPDYTVPTNFKIGINNGTPLAADTALDYSVPIADGTTCDDGSNTFTGSSGGDNSTNNTTTFKAGGGNIDVTAQNLIANGTNATKIWTIAALDTNIDQTLPYGFWLYIKDVYAIMKFIIGGTALRVKFGSDTSNYFYQTFTVAQLEIGWNWITSNITAVEDLSETGTVAGNVDTFIIEIITNLAAQEFAEGDIVYDLLRQWQTTDLIQAFVSGYPTFDESNYNVTIRCYLGSTQANGFLINAVAFQNIDSTPVVTDISSFTAESKSDTDELVFVAVNTLTQG